MKTTLLTCVLWMSLDIPNSSCSTGQYYHLYCSWTCGCLRRIQAKWWYLNGESHFQYFVYSNLQISEICFIWIISLQVSAFRTSLKFKNSAYLQKSNIWSSCICSLCWSDCRFFLLYRPSWWARDPSSFPRLMLNNLIISSLLPVARIPLHETAAARTHPACEWSVKLCSSFCSSYKMMIHVIKAEWYLLNIYTYLSPSYTLHHLNIIIIHVLNMNKILSEHGFSDPFRISSEQGKDDRRDWGSVYVLVILSYRTQEIGI